MKSLHRVRFAWGDVLAIDLETAKGSGRPVLDEDIPSAVYAESELEPDKFALHGVPAMCWRADSPFLFLPFQLREDTEYFIDVTVPGGMESAERAALANAAWPFHERLSKVFKRDPVRRWKDNGNGSVTISGLLRLRSHAGILDMTTPFGGGLQAEVVCRKINYFHDFRALLDEVAEQLAELLLQYDSPISAAFNHSDVNSENEAALLFQLRNVMSSHNLPAAVDELMQDLHSLLDVRRGMCPMNEADDPDIEVFISELDVSTLRKGGGLAGLFMGYSPSEFPIAEVFETFDTAENRYVKYFLEEVQLLAQRLEQRLRQSRKWASSSEARNWGVRLDEILGHGCWSEIGRFEHFPSNSQVIQKRRGYRDILIFDLSLRLSLSLPWAEGAELADGLLGDIRPVSELYEYWCFFMIRGILKEICQEELSGDGSLISFSNAGIQVGLRRGEQSRISFVYRRRHEGSVLVNFFYNRRFRPSVDADAGWSSSYTSQFDPDYSLEVLFESAEGEVKRHWLHFDAKYRLEVSEVRKIFSAGDMAQEQSSMEEGSVYEVEVSRVHKQEDLFKMHTYKDAILGSRGAYLIFPGDRSEGDGVDKERALFVRHPSAFGGGRPTYLIPSVGAFELCPGRGDEQRIVVKEFLERVLEDFSVKGAYQEETGFFPVD